MYVSGSLQSGMQEVEDFENIIRASIRLGIQQPMLSHLELASKILNDEHIHLEAKQRFIRHMLIVMKPLIYSHTNYEMHKSGSCGFMVDRMNTFIDVWGLEENCVEKLDLG
jgi:hypothetical protein